MPFLTVIMYKLVFNLPKIIDNEYWQYFIAHIHNVGLISVQTGRFPGASDMPLGPKGCWSQRRYHTRCLYILINIIEVKYFTGTFLKV